jgi:hypothetical protein
MDGGTHFAVRGVSAGIAVEMGSLRGMNIGTKGICVFTVNSVVTDHQLLLGHAQWHAAYVFDEKKNERCHDDIESDDEKCAVELLVELQISNAEKKQIPEPSFRQ